MRPRLLLPVDLAGQPVELPALAELSREAGAKILHDAAHSLGARFDVEDTSYKIAEGGFADATVLSFHPVKHITSAEGGAVLTPHADLHQRVADLRSHGIHKRREHFHRSLDDAFVGPWYYEQSQLGFNYRLPDLNCALGLSQLARLRTFVLRRRELAALYDQALVRAPFAEHLAPLEQRPGQKNSYHLYVVRLLPRAGETLAQLAQRRKDLYLHLHEQGILAQIHYVPIHWQPEHKDAYLPESGLPGAEMYYAGCLSLPLFPAMEKEDVARVVGTLESALHKLP